MTRVEMGEPEVHRRADIGDLMVEVLADRSVHFHMVVAGLAGRCTLTGQQSRNLRGFLKLCENELLEIEKEAKRG